jgi:hypothetical protein
LAGVQQCLVIIIQYQMVRRATIIQQRRQWLASKVRLILWVPSSTISVRYVWMNSKQVRMSLALGFVICVAVMPNTSPDAAIQKREVVVGCTMFAEIVTSDSD